MVDLPDHQTSLVEVACLENGLSRQVTNQESLSLRSLDHWAVLSRCLEDQVVKQDFRILMSQ